MPQTPVIPVSLHAYQASQLASRPDLLAVEEPLEIRIKYGPASQRQGHTFLTTMRTPGHDEELALGLLYAEGIIQRKEDIREVYHCPEVEKPDAYGNVLILSLAPELTLDPQKLQLDRFSSAACGVCGRNQIEDLKAILPPQNMNEGAHFRAEVIRQIPQKLDEAQTIFQHTGGIHAAALFDSEGTIIRTREDIGRHNALDKLIGRSLLEQQLPLAAFGLLLSGRVGFELVQKAIRARITCIAAVGAPSSLAFQLCQSYGITLIGFLKEDRFNIYTHPEKIMIS